MARPDDRQDGVRAVRIAYSFNKTGFEASCWEQEIRAASEGECTFVPFNHGRYLDSATYLNAWSLNQLYQRRHQPLMRLYAEFEELLRREEIDAILVNNVPPYHPEWLRRLSVYKALYSGDDPDSTYLRNVPYLHAYNHVFFADPVYSPDLDMTEKMRYCGMVNADWLPIGVMDFEMDATRTQDTILRHPRNVEVVYIGSFFRQKLPLLAQVRRALGRSVRLHGYFRAKHNAYFLARYRVPVWWRPLSFADRVNLYQRAAIGFNVHWNEYGLGNQRLYHLPANGVMQISDCADHLERVYSVGTEVVGYRGADELIEKLRYYLSHDQERSCIAKAGYQRVMRDYRFGPLTRRAATLMRAGMDRLGWRR
jgi:spore maturation protein CgeB